MLHTLYGQAMKHNTQFFVEYFSLDLIMDDNGKSIGNYILLDVAFSPWVRAKSKIVSKLYG
jgi:succinate dehydrogenase/fumarate reductase flavoprotein subunit